MRTLARHPAMSTWLVLVLATGLTLLLAETRPSGPGNTVAATVLVIGFGKVWLVGRSFMELHRAPRALRLAFTAWCVTVGAAVVGTVLLG